jgi:hypothetical protein
MKALKAPKPHWMTLLQVKFELDDVPEPSRRHIWASSGMVGVSAPLTPVHRPQAPQALVAASPG